jgi:glutamine synthetase
MIDMARKQILPSSVEYAEKLASSIVTIKQAVPSANVSAQQDVLCSLSDKIALFSKAIDVLVAETEKAQSFEGSSYDKASLYRNCVFKSMEELRAYGDELETIVDAKLWPVPTYGDMLFNI